VLSTTADEGQPRSTRLVDPPTVAATRAILDGLVDGPGGVEVIGWADITSPNLVDLLDDLLAGPGGAHLRAIAVPWPRTGAAWAEDVAVARGLSCLQRAGLGLCLVGVGPADLPERLHQIEPGLRVLTGYPTGAGR
jgi:hypothetical protein